MKRVYTLHRGVERIRTAADQVVSSVLAGVAVLGAAIALPLVAAHAAPNQVVVTPTSTHGWTTADTRPGGAVAYSSDTTAPGNPHNGALQLTTSAAATAKAQYMHDTTTPLADVSALSYATKQTSAPFTGADASYQLATCLLGYTPAVDSTPAVCNGFTTFVYEPYENGTVTPGTWQTWDVTAGQLWSSRTVSGGGCSVAAGAGGAPFYTLTGLQANCPSAVVVGFGVNIGSNNPSYDVQADLVNFNDTIYNFEPFAAVADKDACKNDGWKTAVDASGNGFKNQGACVSYVASGGKSQH